MKTWQAAASGSMIVVALLLVGASPTPEVVVTAPPTTHGGSADELGSPSTSEVSSSDEPVDPAEAETDEAQTDEPQPVVSEGQRTSAATWTMIFNDEFEGTRIDDSTWTACYWWDREGCSNEGNEELEWYLPEQRFVRDGVLHLRAEEGEVEASNGKTYPYRSGMVTSGRPTNDFVDDPGFAFTYGYVEARVRVPVGQGLWPAFWLLPITHESRPEIDILEVLGHRPDIYELHYHTHDESGERQSFGSEFIDADLEEGWHVVAVDWSPDAIVWMIDGVERWRVEELVAAEPLYMIFNLAVGGEWPGAPDDSTEFPADFEIDYVRVWQSAE